MKTKELHEAHRQAHSFLRTGSATKKLIEVLGPRYKERNGGYTRILRAGHRYGDWAEMCYLEYVDNGLMPLQTRTKKEEISTEEAQIVESTSSPKAAKTKSLEDVD